MRHKNSILNNVINSIKNISKKEIKDIYLEYNKNGESFYIDLNLFLNSYEKYDIKQIKGTKKIKELIYFPNKNEAAGIVTRTIKIKDYSYFLLYNFLIMKKENFSFKELIGYEEKDDINKTVENLNNICKKILLKIADETQNNEETKTNTNTKLKVEKIIQFNLKQLAKYNNNICNLEEINI